MTSPIPGSGNGRPMKPLPVKPGRPVKPLPVKPGKPSTPVVRPGKPSTMPIDDSKLFRKLPITEKDLKVIKKHYGIK